MLRISFAAQKKVNKEKGRRQRNFAICYRIAVFPRHPSRSGIQFIALWHVCWPSLVDCLAQ
jgi:hypothetical protein